MTILDYDIFPYLFVYYSISICHIYCTLFIEKYNKSFCCSAINFRIIFFSHPHGMAKMRMKKKKCITLVVYVPTFLMIMKIKIKIKNKKN
jgi:hypothetical protein